MSILSDHYYDDRLRGRIAQAICETIQDALAEGVLVRTFEASWICRAHAVDHRFDFHRGGQDVCGSRINFSTDGKSNVRGAYLG